MKKKRYEDGGLTFTEMSDEDRAASAKAAIEALNARQAEKSKEAGGESEAKAEPVKRAAPKVSVAKTESKPAPKEVKAEVPRAERAPSSVKPEPITGPKPAKSAEAAMPDTAARKAATAERLSKSRSGKLGTQGVYGMKSGGSVSSASKRGDGCAIRGKTKGRMV